MREVASVPSLRARARFPASRSGSGANEDSGAPASGLTLPSGETIEYVWPCSSALTIAVEPEGELSIARIGELGAEPGHFNARVVTVAPGRATDLVSSEPDRAIVIVASSRAIAWPPGIEPRVGQPPFASRLHNRGVPSSQAARTSKAGASAPAAVLAEA